MSETSAVQLDCPHATEPTLCWRVELWEWESDPNGKTLGAVRARDALGGPFSLYVPPRDAWTPDTLRMVLYELAAYLPAHESAEAACIVTGRFGSAGRPPKPPAPRRPLRLNYNSIGLGVQARGWRAFVETWKTWTNAGEAAAEEDARQYGWWSAPMLALLADCIRQSPFPLAPIRQVLSASSASHQRASSRRRGPIANDRPAARERNEYIDAATFSNLQRLLERLKDIRRRSATDDAN